MDADEKDVYNYMKSCSGQFVSGREVARRAGGKWRFRDDPNWAAPILLRFVEKAILDSDAAGYYRLLPRETKKPKKWISPQIRAILEKSGKNFGEVLEVDESEEFLQ